MSYYYDYNATTFPDKKIIKDILNKDFKTVFGNPSSLHWNGISANGILFSARKQIADCLNVNENEIIFTSGGTESDNLAIKGIMLKKAPNEAEMITSSFEHPAVLNTCKELEKLGYKVHYVNPTREGIIFWEDIEKHINEKTQLVSIMAVNNEIGTIQDISKFGRLCHEKGIIFHSDCVQGVGLYNLNLKNVDLASFSAHKFGGLKQNGFLYKKENIDLKPIIVGGGQENGLRAGTENVFGNILMAKALKNTLSKWNNETKGIIRAEINDLEISLKREFGDNVKFNTHHNISVDNCTNISFKNIDGQTLQLFLSSEGYYVSTGSACHSSIIAEPSHVLKAINVPDEFIHGSLRISCGYNFKDLNWKGLKKAIISNVKKMYKK